MAKTDILTSLTTPARAKILRLLVLHDKETFTFSEISRRAGVGAHATRTEVLMLKKSGIVREEKVSGKTAVVRARSLRFGIDTTHPEWNALSAFIHEVSPEQFGEVEKTLRRTGRVSVIVLSGVFVGDSTRPADILLVGDSIDDERLEKAVRSFEPKYGREIRYAVFSTPEFRYRLTIHDRIVRDTLDYPHRVLVNKHNLV